MTDAGFLFVIFLLEVTLFYFLPTLNGQGTLFGIVLKDDDFKSHGAPLLRAYRRDLLVLAALSMIGVFAAVSFAPNSLPVAYIFAGAFVILPLFKYLPRAWRVRAETTVSRLAAPIVRRSLRDFTNYAWELAVVVLTVAPFAVLAFYYPRLPDVVPIHWNAAGEADGWSRKSVTTVFFVPILAAFLQILWILLKQDIIGARFRVPADGGRAERISMLKEMSLRANVELVDWCRLLVGCLLAGVGLLVLSSVFQPDFSGKLNVVIWTTLILFLAGIAFYLYRMVLASREIKSLTGQITFQTATESAGWSGGGLFYSNPQDAAFMVEKPGGVGYTINFAHKRRVFVYLALILSPAIFVLLDLALSGGK